MNHASPAVAFCFDRHYARYCQVALFSLIVSHGRNVRVHCICTDDVAAVDIDNLQSLADRLGVDVRFLSVPASGQVSGWKTSGHLTEGVYLRLLLPDLLPMEDKVLYLDCDVIVKKPLDDLYGVDIDRFRYAGVIDKLGSAASRIDAPFRQNYVNSGVLLMNLKALREDDAFEKMRVLHDTHRSKITWGDQCLINIYAHEHVRVLDEQYNFQISHDGCNRQRWLDVREGKAIYHFVGNTKPWHARARRHISEFWWGFASVLDCDRLRPIRSSTYTECMVECESLEEYDEYRKACEVKDRIIRSFVSHVKNSKAAGVA